MYALELILGSFLFGFFAFAGRIACEVVLLRYAMWTQKRKYKSLVAAATAAARVGQSPTVPIIGGKVN